MNNNFYKKKSEVTWYILNIAIYLFYYILLHNLFYALLFTIPNMLFTILLINNIEKCIKQTNALNIYRLISVIIVGLSINLALIALSIKNVPKVFFFIEVTFVISIFAMYFFRGFICYTIDKILNFFQK